MEQKQQLKKQEPIKFLVLSASFRETSLNEQLIQLASGIIENRGGKIDYATMKEFECQSYNGDWEQKYGTDVGAAKFHERLLKSDALMKFSRT